MRLLVTLLCLAAASPAAAQSLTVLSSNATKALIEELGPQFEKATGQKLTRSLRQFRGAQGPHREGRSV